MRKLVVVMLTVGSLLLLEAPALAQHLYSLSPESGGRSGGQLSGKIWFSGETDCAGAVKVYFADGREGTAPKGAVNPATKKRTIRVSTTGSATRSDVSSATCNGVLMTLPMTGVSAAHKLAFAALLLVTGVVLLFLGRRRAGAGPG